MTTTTYQVTDYLLDRANIHDTVTRFVRNCTSKT